MQGLISQGIDLACVANEIYLAVCLVNKLSLDTSTIIHYLFYVVARRKPDIFTVVLQDILYELFSFNNVFYYLWS